jgi:predicted RNA-binding Zn-ribbon protein involved in translation (DUF1610 family)
MEPHFHRHSCPNCGHYVGWRRLHLGSRYAQWACESCGSQLCYGANSKWLSVLISLTWFVLPALLFMRFHLIHWWGFMLLMLAGIIPTVGVLRVVSAKATTASMDLHEHAKDA